MTRGANAGTDPLDRPAAVAERVFCMTDNHAKPVQILHSRSHLSVTTNHLIVCDDRGRIMAERPKRRTPIERYIDDGAVADRRNRWEEKQRELGWTRVTVRVHVDDVQALKEFAARLQNARRGP